MKNINNNYFYYDHWWVDDKEPDDKLTLQEVKRRFESGEVFYILVGDEKKPSHIITNLGKDVMTIQTLNNNLDSILKLDYEIMENIDKEKLFLCRARVYGKEFTKTLAWSVIYDYNDGNALYEILKYPRYEELNLLTNIEETGEIDTPVEEKLHWRDYPKFGKWDFMVEDSLAFKELIDKDKF